MQLFSKSKLTILLLVAILLTTTGFGCRCTPKGVKEAIKPIKLVYWRVWDDQDSMIDIINAYREFHPYVDIVYRQLRYEEYENALKEAWLRDEGPDIFSIPNTWIGKYQDLILPLPEKITIPYQHVKKTLWKKELITELKTEKTLSLKNLRENFVDAVYKDIIRDNTILALPLSLDTLVLFYNKDLLNNANLPLPPKTWDEFKDQAEKMTFLDKQGNILQAGAALGTAENIIRSTDILSLLMMQNGTQMIGEGGQAVFDQPAPDNREYSPGQDALRFYTDFSNPSREIYTWNDKMPQSLDAFIQGKAAFFFGYSYHLAQIQAQAPKLNFDISPIPQLSGTLKEVNFANYWTETAYYKTKHPNEAWDFIQFATSEKQVNKYLEKTKKPTALKALINQQLEDYDLETFARQVLTSRSWYQGKDFNAVENIFKEMINSVVEGKATYGEAINQAVAKVNQTL
jgi:ABC-type glycerol-3-phosphate transport system substrate-binding protein